MGRITVVGVGPGGEDHLTKAAMNAVKKADLLVGGERQLALFPKKREKHILTGHIDNALQFIQSNRDKRIAVLSSGDPGYYSILRALLRMFKPDELEIIPGVSSMQLCFAKSCMPWDDAEFISLHGRKSDGLIERIAGSKKIAILTDEKMPPDLVARRVLSAGIGKKRAAVGESLSLRDERFVKGSLQEISEMKFKGQSVMVIYDEER